MAAAHTNSLALPGTPPVQVIDLEHAFGDRQVLHGVFLELRAGEIYGLLGPNGSGKTTLMKAICGRLRPLSGSVLVGGRDPSTDMEARRRISFVPQEISLYPHLTVAENLALFGRFSGVPRLDLARVVGDMLVSSALADRADQLCRTLSGGYQRRVNICASLLHKPSTIVLDEPTVGIDIDAREAIHGLLQTLREQGTAMLIATHDLEQAQTLCDRVGLLQEGRLVLEGRPAMLLTQTFGTDKELIATFRTSPGDLGQALTATLGWRPTQSPLTWFGRTHGRLDPSVLAEQLQLAGLQVKEIRIREPDLSSLFLDKLGQGAPAGPSSPSGGPR